MAVPVSDKAISLGRADENDVILSADGVSRFHARLARKNGITILTDLKSLNGTYVNRQRIAEVVLKHLDDIWFGNKCHLIYRDDTVYGTETGSSTPAKEQRDSDLNQTIRSIRQEIDQAGKNLTLKGRSAGESLPTVLGDQAPPVTTQEEIQWMSRAYHRLAALYKAHQLITADFDLNTRLNDMLQSMMTVLQAKRGFVLLREEQSDTLRALVSIQMGGELTACSPSMGIAGRSAIDGEPVLMHDRISNREFGGRASIIEKRITSAMCVPLKVKDVILGSIYVDTDDPDMHFCEEDLELFSSLASQAALAIENVRLHDRVVESEKRRVTLARFLPEALVEKIINESETLALGGRKTMVTTLFCDIRGSSQIAEQVDPQSLVALLNEHFTAMTEIVFAYEGTLDKYIGDELMAIFGAPIEIANAPLRAVCAAIDMQRKNTALNAVRAAEQRPELHLGIGIESGEVVAGYIGSPKRMDFTVVGDRVNTAKRFCDMAGPGTIVVGEETWQAVREHVEARPMGTLMLKGKQRAVQAYEVLGLRPKPDA